MYLAINQYSCIVYGQYIYIYIYIYIYMDILFAVISSLSMVKTCTVNGSSDGNDDTRVKVTAPSDSPTEVTLLNNRTPMNVIRRNKQVVLHRYNNIH